MKALHKEHRILLRFAIIFTVFLLAFAVCRTEASAKVTINKSSIKLNPGKTYKLKLKGVPSGAKVVWKTGKKEVAKVNSKGKVTAVKSGTTMVTATVNGMTYFCSVQVKRPVTKISLNYKSGKMNVGRQLALVAKVTPSNASNKSVTWKSSNKKVAKVTSKGVVKAVGTGKATITAKAKDGSGKKATFKVTVTNSKIKVTSVSLNKKTASVAKGKTLALVSTVKPATATNTSVKWSSSNTSVATVNQSGLVKAVSAGKATITATAADGSGKQASCTVTVKVNGSRGEEVLSYMRKYEAKLQSDLARGIKWSYSQEGSRTWADSIKDGDFRCNCARLAQWALKEMGIMEAKHSVFGNNGSLKFNSTAAKNAIYNNCEVLHVVRPARDLINDGTLQPGDICTWIGMVHTNIYAGDKLWYDAGRNGVGGHWEGSVYMFDSWGPINSAGCYNGTVDYIIRAK